MPCTRVPIIGGGGYAIICTRGPRRWYWAELQARGGAPALRAWLDKPAKRKAPAET